ncbi:MAG: phage integrase N-terminal SAM-like domain-containing protein [Anaerolineales bacterium]|nr:phage integrase N-terminal SAM-like domain-containing protein [Anaerolineales bacterium]
MRDYSLRTEQTYIAWVRRYILFHNKRHPREMGATEINQFTSHLAVEKKVSASTQNQALSAVLFLYRYVLKVELDESVISDLRPAKSKHIPTVLSKKEAKAVIENMQGIYRLMAQILYGSGLRLMEVLRLRVKDLDFQNRQIIVRDGKACPEPAEGAKTTASPCFPALCSNPCACTSTRSRPCTSAISPKALEPSTCPTLWNASIQMPAANGAGSMFSRPLPVLLILSPVSSGGITFTKLPCKKQSKPPPASQR